MPGSARVVAGQDLVQNWVDARFGGPTVRRIGEDAGVVGGWVGRVRPADGGGGCPAGVVGVGGLVALVGVRHPAVLWCARNATAGPTSSPRPVAGVLWLICTISVWLADSGLSRCQRPRRAQLQPGAPPRSCPASRRGRRIPGHVSPVHESCGRRPAGTAWPDLARQDTAGRVGAGSGGGWWLRTRAGFGAVDAAGGGRTGAGGGVLPQEIGAGVGPLWCDAIRSGKGMGLVKLVAVGVVGRTKCEWLPPIRVGAEGSER